MSLKELTQGGHHMRIIIETDTVPTVQTVAAGSAETAAETIQAIDAGAAPFSMLPELEVDQVGEERPGPDPAKPIDAGAPATEFIEAMEGIDPIDREKLWETLGPKLGPDDIEWES